MLPNGVLGSLVNLRSPWVGSEATVHRPIQGLVSSSTAGEGTVQTPGVRDCADLSVSTIALPWLLLSQTVCCGQVAHTEAVSTSAEAWRRASPGYSYSSHHWTVSWLEIQLLSTNVRMASYRVLGYRVATRSFQANGVCKGDMPPSLKFLSSQETSALALGGKVTKHSTQRGLDFLTVSSSKTS